jgi:tetratricopeptide (TPR) repeat protein
MLRQGNTSREAGRYYEAEYSYQQALRLNPSSAARALYGLGNVYFAKGESQRAEQSYKDAIRLDNDFQDAYIALGFALIQSNDEAKKIEAEQVAKQALVRNSKDGRVWDLLGSVMEARGFAAAEVEPYYRRAVETDPNYALGYFHLGEFLSSKGNRTEATQYLYKAFELNPTKGSVSLYRVFGEELQRQGRYGESLEPARQILKLYPTDERALYLIAQVVFGSGEYEAAIALLEPAIKLDTKLVIAYEALAWAHIMVDRPDRAEEVLDKASSLVATTPIEARMISEGMVGAGDAYRNLRQKENAVRIYQKAIKLDPSNSTVKDKLAKLLK